MAYVEITIFLLAVFAIAAFMTWRSKSQIRPIVAKAAAKRQGRVLESLIGLPQLIADVRGTTVRLTPMSKSHSSPDGGDMTCLDFNIAPMQLSAFRLQEMADFRRSALPAALMEGHKIITLDNPKFDARFRLFAVDPLQAKRILQTPKLTVEILQTSQGADIHIEEGKCHVVVNGLPGDLQFVDALIGLAELLVECFADEQLRVQAGAKTLLEA